MESLKSTISTDLEYFTDNLNFNKVCNALKKMFVSILAYHKMSFKQ